MWCCLFEVRVGLPVCGVCVWGYLCVGLPVCGAACVWGCLCVGLPVCGAACVWRLCVAPHVILIEMDSWHTVKLLTVFHSPPPQSSPFRHRPMRSCAVVGSGGILLNSCCGAEIDRADYVIRFNLPPMNYSYDIGRKSDMVTANPSILINKYSRLNARRRSFMDLVKMYEPAMILMPAFSYSMNTDVSYKAYYTLEDFRSQQKVVYAHSHYLANLRRYWMKNGLKAPRLSSGLILVSAALEVCDKVTLYGFWPFPQGVDGNMITNHYYDNVPPKPGFHSMPDEFSFYAKMHSQGILRLKVGRCF
uniref:ST8 alpha-N-acetyl-neuraminide alpha-2,8-sialyltransferase 6 n=1 Tax=Leptobrachium leishanense TaxID=445787 RepID=A0A8C5WIL6_9ANUR